MRTRALIERFAPLVQHLLTPPPPNDIGNRDIEYSFIAANLPYPDLSHFRVLDVGCGRSWLGLIPARMGYDVLAVDLREISWNFRHPRLRFQCLDVLSLPSIPNSYDLILCCSTIEHIGLRRYGNKTESNSGDLETIQHLHRLLSPRGFLLLTTQVGKEKVVKNVHRIYGQGRLGELLKGFKVTKEEYWGKNGSNQWIEMDRGKAFEVEGNDHYYALALFVLRKV